MNQLIAEAEIGEEARKFIESDLGRTLVGMAQQEILSAQIALGTVDPDDKKAIVALQNQIWRGEQFEQWLKELVSRGNDAMNAYVQQRSN